MTELKNINDAIMSSSENNLVHVIRYGNKNFDNSINVRMLNATIKLIFDQPLF